METKRALLIEDDPICRDILTDILQSSNYRVIALTSPLCFGTLDNDFTCPMRRPYFDVLIVDINLPVENGLVFLANQRRKGCKVPGRNIAAISGGWTWEERQRAMKLGIVVLDKPIRVADVTTWLETCL